MPDFDVEAFVAKLDRMGLKLTSVPLADGKLRINRWRMLNAGEHTQQIHDLWAMQIGNNQERIDVLAAHLAKAAPQVTANRINPNRTRIGPMQSATATTMPAGSKIAAAQSTSTSLRASIGAPKPAGVQATADQPNPVGPRNAIGLHGAAGLQKVPGMPSSDGLPKAK
jgi:hypothetical protein